MVGSFVPEHYRARSEWRGRVRAFAQPDGYIALEMKSASQGQASQSDTPGCAARSRTSEARQLCHSPLARDPVNSLSTGATTRAKD